MLLQEAACGKLNLALDVLGRRPDGYHDMRMVMQSVALHDTVTVELDTGKPWQLECRRERDGLCSLYPQDSGNLAWRAAEVFCRAADCTPDGIRITIEKRIPAQAGMAGGSADAAAVLRALNRGCGAPFTTAELCRLGAQIGSDVPYCVLGGTALAEGRGEVLTPLQPIPPVWFVLAKPEFSISTPVLFRELDAAPAGQQPDIPGMLEAIACGDAAQIGARMENVFQPVVSRSYPVVQTICRLLRESGALGAQLTGTGSVVFGMFRDQTTAALAAEALRAHTAEVFLTQPV